MSAARCRASTVGRVFGNAKLMVGSAAPPIYKVGLSAEHDVALRPAEIVPPTRLMAACSWDQAVPGTTSASFSASAR